MKPTGTAADSWVLKTPPLTSAFTMHRETIDGSDLLICTVGKTVLHRFAVLAQGAIRHTLASRASQMAERVGFERITRLKYQ